MERCVSDARRSRYIIHYGGTACPKYGSLSLASVMIDDQPTHRNIIRILQAFCFGFCSQWRSNTLITASIFVVAGGQFGSFAESHSP